MLQSMEQLDAGLRKWTSLSVITDLQISTCNT
jgi:hypothetical protein